jgi:hypothetical protein
LKKKRKDKESAFTFVQYKQEIMKEVFISADKTYAIEVKVLNYERRQLVFLFCKHFRLSRFM